MSHPTPYRKAHFWLKATSVFVTQVFVCTTILPVWAEEKIHRYEDPYPPRYQEILTPYTQSETNRTMAATESVSWQSQTKFFMVPPREKQEKRGGVPNIFGRLRPPSSLKDGGKRLGDLEEALGSNTPDTVAGIDAFLQTPLSRRRVLALGGAAFIASLLPVPLPFSRTPEPLFAQQTGPVEIALPDLVNSQFHKDSVTWVDRQRFGSRQMSGFDFDGLYQSYQDGPHPYARFIAKYGRVWVYDAALGIYSDLKNGREDQAKKAVDTLVDIAKKEEGKGFKGLWHFSYNTAGDNFIDPRGPLGANLWAINAVYAYILQTGDTRHLDWMNDKVKTFLLDEAKGQQVMDPADPRHGLFRAGLYNAEDAAKGDAMGYAVYEGEMNVQNENVFIEHNSDAAGTLRLAFHATKKFRREDSAFKQLLIKRHELLMRGLQNFWMGDHFVTAMHAGGTLNRSVAVDNESWVGAAVLPYDEEKAWQAIQYLQKNFVVTTREVEVLTGDFANPKRSVIQLPEPATGLFFFTKDFKDPYVPTNPRYEEMIQPEATFGAIAFLKAFIETTKDSKRKEEAGEFLATLYDGVLKVYQAYGDEGSPYATLNIPGYFNNMSSMAATATGAAVMATLRGAPGNDFIYWAPPEEFTVDGRSPTLAQTQPIKVRIKGEPPVREEKPEEQKPAPQQEAAPSGKIGIQVQNFSSNAILLKLSGSEALLKNATVLALIKTDAWYIQPYADSTFDVGKDGIVRVENFRGNFERGNTLLLVVDKKKWEEARKQLRGDKSFMADWEMESGPLADAILAESAQDGSRKGMSRREFLAFLRDGMIVGTAMTVTGLPRTIPRLFASDLDDEVDWVLQRLPLEEKVALFQSMGWLGKDPLQDDVARSLLLDRQIGVFTLYDYNLGSASETARMVADMMEAAAIEGTRFPIFNIDAEGGRLYTNVKDATMVPGNMALGAIGTADLENAAALAYQQGRMIARELRAWGATWALAPVIDVNSNPLNPVIGNRSIGEDKETVAAVASAIIRGYQDEGVAATVKHVPDHGDTAFDTHTGLPVDFRSREDIDGIYALRAAIKNGVAALMPSHVTYPNAFPDPNAPKINVTVPDPEDPTKTVNLDVTPATVSPAILTDFFRKELGFEGLIITDALEMGAIIDNFGIGYAGLLALEAGADIFIAGTDPNILEKIWEEKFGRTYTPEDQMEAQRGIVRAASEGIITTARKGPDGKYVEEEIPISGERRQRLLRRIDESARRVLKFKLTWGLQNPPDPMNAVRVVGAYPHQHLAEIISEEAVTLLKASLGQSLKGLSQGSNIVVIRPQYERLTPADSSYKLGFTLVDHIKARHGNTRGLAVLKPLPEKETSYEKENRQHAEQALVGEERPHVQVVRGIDEAMGEVADADVVVVETYFAHQSAFQKNLLEGLLRTGKRVVHLVSGNPYDAAISAEKADIIIAGYSPHTAEAMTKVLFEEIEPKGNLPVTIPGIFNLGAGLSAFPQASRDGGEKRLPGLEELDRQRLLDQFVTAPDGARREMAAGDGGEQGRIASVLETEAVQDLVAARKPLKEVSPGLLEPGRKVGVLIVEDKTLPDATLVERIMTLPENSSLSLVLVSQEGKWRKIFDALQAFRPEKEQALPKEEFIAQFAKRFSAILTPQIILTAEGRKPYANPKFQISNVAEVIEETELATESRVIGFVVGSRSADRYHTILNTRRAKGKPPVIGLSYSFREDLGDRWATLGASKVNDLLHYLGLDEAKKNEIMKQWKREVHFVMPQEVQGEIGEYLLTHQAAIRGL